MAADDTGRFLHADNKDSTITPEREETHFEAGVVPRTSNISDPSLAPYMDKAWALVFLANVCITVFAATYFKVPTHPAEGHLRRLAADGGHVGMQIGFTAIVLCLVVWGLSSGTLTLLARHPKRTLQGAYLGFIGIWAIVGVGALLAGQTLTALVIGGLCGLCLVYFVKRQSRIRFGAANVKVAAIAVKAISGIIRYPLLMTIILGVWTSTSSHAARGTISASWKVVGPDGTSYPAVECQDERTYPEHAEDGYSYQCVCGDEKISADSACEYRNSLYWYLVTFWLASGFWGAAVVHNVTAATVTGSVASWWFSPDTALSVRGAFRRAVTGSFGSLCKAALAITVVRLVLYPVRRLCLVRQFVASIRYGLSYAVCFVSIYGLSFNEALRRVSELFRQRGMTAITNDAVVGIGLHLLGVVVTWVYLAAILLAFMAFMGVHPSEMMEPLGFIFLLVGAMVFLLPGTFVFWTMLQVVRSSQKAVFVCFVQDPGALQANHDRQMHDDLSWAWQQALNECPATVSSDPTHMIECQEMDSGPSTTPTQNHDGSKMATISGVAAYGAGQV